MDAKQLRPKADQAVSLVSAVPALVSNIDLLLKRKLSAAIEALVISCPEGLIVTWHILDLRCAGASQIWVHVRMHGLRIL